MPSFSLSNGPARQFTADALFTGEQPDFVPQQTSQAPKAAGLVNLGSAYHSARKNAVNYTDIGNAAMEGYATENIAAMQAEGQVASAGLQAYGQAKRSKLIADGAKAAAQSAASGSMMGSALSAVGSIGGALLAFSDERTKDHIKRIDDALEVLRELRPVTFHYQDDWSYSPERMHHGFIAQEFMQVVPDATYFDESTEKLCIDPVELIGLLVRSVQQLETRIAYLEAQRSLAGVK